MRAPAGITPELEAYFANLLAQQLAERDAKHQQEMEEVKKQHAADMRDLGIDKVQLVISPDF